MECSLAQSHSNPVNTEKKPTTTSTVPCATQSSNVIEASSISLTNKPATYEADSTLSGKSALSSRTGMATLHANYAIFMFIRA